MSTVSQFDTQTVRNGDVRQPDTSTQVNFPGRPFVAPPHLPHGIRQLDVGNNINIRVKTAIENITQTSGIYHITSWADTTFHGGIVDSLNLAPTNLEFLTGEHLRIFTSVNMLEVRPLSNPQLQQSKSIGFGDVEFWKKPNIFVALNSFDIGCGANFRLKAYIDNVVQKELTWHIDAWDNTVLYSASATIIAVN
ncbi:hypothetical protein PAXINDRAFT_153713 [Paxillus involutus ATCC 200175]|nr:hypothetical protein PAXINDRAFT_153713 [Paxillus involutus ATCC 200175]